MDTNTQSPTAQKTYLPIKLFSDKHPAFPESSLRWLIFNRETNGFGGCFFKIGKRVLIDEEKFFAKVEENRM